MPLVEFSQIINAADEGEYAVGYFESWSLESLLAVADAAEAVRSPVILGFSGIYLPHPDRLVADPLAAYAAMARAVGEALSIQVVLSGAIILGAISAHSFLGLKGHRTVGKEPLEV